MKIAVLGTGVVGQTIGSKLTSLGHEVKMGSRKAGGEKATAWVKQAGAIASEGTFKEAAQFGELAFNCTNGAGALEAVKSASEQLKDKILVDVSNPLDFSKGMPPTLLVCNTDSLGEQIQRACPEVKVVKALNTVNAELMVNPHMLVSGDHTMLVCGNDAAAKSTVKDLLRDGFGWNDLVDLGDISNARGLEMYLPLWVRLFGAFKSPMFSIKIVRAM